MPSSFRFVVFFMLNSGWLGLWNSDGNEDDIMMMVCMYACESQRKRHHSLNYKMIAVFCFFYMIKKPFRLHAILFVLVFFQENEEQVGYFKKVNAEWMNLMAYGNNTIRFLDLD